VGTGKNLRGWGEDRNGACGDGDEILSRAKLYQVLMAANNVRTARPGRGITYDKNK